MLSISLARQLKEAGLAWKPTLHDFFAIPDSGMDDRLFVLGDMLAYVELIRGRPAVTFHGSVEWALDYILLAELLWMPTETQLREELERRLVGEQPPALQLMSTFDGYQCTIRLQDGFHSFEAFGASEAYGLALLHVLHHSPGVSG